MHLVNKCRSHCTSRELKFRQKIDACSYVETRSLASNAFLYVEVGVREYCCIPTSPSRYLIGEVTATRLLDVSCNWREPMVPDSVLAVPSFVQPHGSESIPSNQGRASAPDFSYHRPRKSAGLAIVSADTVQTQITLRPCSSIEESGKRQCSIRVQIKAIVVA